MKSLRSSLRNNFHEPALASGGCLPRWLISLRGACAHSLRLQPLIGALQAGCGDSGSAEPQGGDSAHHDTMLATEHHERDAGAAEDAGAPVKDGGMLYKECSGPPYGQGTCESNQVCAAMPHVPYKYCMSRPPCDADMVEVTKVACAYPCEQASDCEPYQLAHCATNDLAELTGEAMGWCTP